MDGGSYGDRSTYQRVSRPAYVIGGTVVPVSTFHWVFSRGIPGEIPGRCMYSVLQNVGVGTSNEVRQGT